MSQSSLNNNEPNRKKEPLIVQRIYKFLSAFWAIASILSFMVNIILIIIVLVMLQRLSVFQFTDQTSGLIAGLYTSFEEMDNASIQTQVIVNSAIPVKFVLPVQSTTRIILVEDTVINNAHIIMNSGGMNIDSDATVVLPANTPLTVALDFPIFVDSNIPVSLNVPIDVPLRNTELHSPLVRLQQSLNPFYCLVSPNAKSVIDNSSICDLQLP